jgi:hypothetical protein
MNSRPGVNVIKLMTPVRVRVEEGEHSGGAVLTFLKAGMTKEQTMSAEKTVYNNRKLCYSVEEAYGCFGSWFTRSASARANR